MNRIRDFIHRKLVGFSTTQVSSRPLGLVRIFAMLMMIYEFSAQYALHRMDYELPVLLLIIVLLGAVPFGLVGYKTRWALGVIALAYAILHNYYGAHLGHHGLAKPVQVFQVLVLLALLPSGRSLSIDRMITVQRAIRTEREPEPERMPWWQLELFLVEICVIYFWAAENKTDSAWLHGERMERYYVLWFGGSDSLLYTPWVHQICVVLAWATTTLEFVLAFGLLSRRFRPWVALGGVMLHVGILLTLSVPFFSIMMLTLLMVAIPPQYIHDFFSRIGEEPAQPSS